jgi:hypothetical protein
MDDKDRRASSKGEPRFTTTDTGDDSEGCVRGVLETIRFELVEDDGP